MDLQALKAKFSLLDRFLEFFSSAMLLSLIGIPLFYYNKIPHSITIHSSETVLANILGNFPTIWILPIVGLIIYLGLNAIIKTPYIISSPQKFGDKNMDRKLSLKIRKLRFVKLIITSAFAFISYKMAQTALLG